MNQVMLHSHELKSVLNFAETVREHFKSPKVGSMHILMAMTMVKQNTCYGILKKQGVTFDDVKDRPGLKTLMTLAATAAGPGRPLEPDETMSLIEAKAHQLTRDQAMGTVFSPAYLVAMLRVQKCAALQILEKAGCKVASLRTEASAKLAEMGIAVRGNALQDGPESALADPPALPDRAPAVRPPAPRQIDLAPGPLVKAIPDPLLGQRPEPPAAQVLEVQPPADTEGSEAFVLDEDRFPLLARMSRNLTLEAALNRIDPVIGRRKEIDQMIQILLKRRTNNPCLIGEPGVGKTALVEGLALEIAQRNPRARALHGRLLLSLETSSLVAGTSLRGSFSERMQELRKEVKDGDGRFLIFIDEIHTIVGAGGGESALDAANELKAALARGEFPCIGATTMQEYKKHIESDPALERRFQTVMVAEPPLPEALEIIKGILPFYREHHRVSYSERALELAVRLSVRYVHDRHLPDKAIDILDRAGARANMEGRSEVDEELVALLVADKVGIPVEKLLLNASSRYKALLDSLEASVVGHEKALRRVADALKRGLAGFSGGKPMATMLFAGPSGVGKKQCARALASFLFDSPEALRTFEGSEYTESHSVAKLIGTSPGYVGHEQGGQLVEALYRRPFQVLLFHNFHLAHPEVQELLARMLRSGTLVDGKGRTVWFSNCVIIVTVDLDPRVFSSRGGKGVGFVPGEASAGSEDERLWEAASGAVPQVLKGAVDEALLFGPLSQDEMLAVARLLVDDSARRLAEEQDIHVTVTDEALQYLVDRGGFSPSKGAHPMRSVLQAELENRLAEQILDGGIQRGHRVTVTTGVDGLEFLARRPVSIRPR